jgi:hypothetical protein
VGWAAVLCLLLIAGAVALLAEPGAGRARAPVRRVPREAAVDSDRAPEPPTPVGLPPPPVERPPPRPAEPELPGCYFGELTIGGIVRDERGTSMAGLRVECLPSGIVPFTERGLARFACTTDAGGSFGFEALPEAARYVFRAAGTGAYGEATRTLEEVRGTVVEIEVSSQVSYERYDFFDQEGSPVDVRGRFAFGVGDLIWMSGFGLSPEIAARLRSIGVAMEDLPHNAAVAVFKRRYPTRQAGPAGDAVVPLTIRIPGYEEARVEPVRFRPGEWPGSIRVTLRAEGPRRIAHEVRFPAVPWNDAPPEVEALWERTALRVRVGAAQTECTVSRAQPRFWAADGEGFELRLWSCGTLVPHEVRETAGGVEVSLELPDLALPFLRFDPAGVPWAHVRDQEQVHFQVEEAGFVSRGRIWRPGLVIFDPMPPSGATLRCVWPQGRGFDSRAKVVTLVAGACELRWEEPPTTAADAAR